MKTNAHDWPSLPLNTLRGSGPAPPGFRVCFFTDCPARRDPSTGRFTRRGGHYHPSADFSDACGCDVGEYCSVCEPRLRTVGL